MLQAAEPMDHILARSYARDIELAVKENKVSDAIDKLQDFVRDLAPHLRIDTLVLCQRYSSFSRDLRLGLAKREDITPIIGALLDVTDEALKAATVSSRIVVAPAASSSTAQTKPATPAHRTFAANDLHVSSIAGLAPISPLTSVEPEQRGDGSSNSIERRTAPETYGTSTMSGRSGPGTDMLPTAGWVAANDDAPPSISASLDELRRFYWRIYRQSQPPSQTVAFDCRDVTKAYTKGTFRLEPTTLKLSLGEITGVVGRNASGKTTLLRIVLGQLEPDSGTRSYPALTRDGTSWPHIKKQIAYVPQESSRWNGTLRVNLSFYAALHGARGKDNTDIVDWHLHRYGLKPFEHFTWRELTGGLRTRFELIRVLISKPRLLVLDEPLAHLDVIARQEFLSYLKTISTSFEQPLPIIITSQHLYEIEAVADQMVILDGGKCLFSGAIVEISGIVRNRMLEINVRCGRQEMLNALASFDVLELSEAIDGYMVGFDKNTPREEVLAALQHHFGERLLGFRDVTGSGRSLMQGAGFTAAEYRR